MERTFDHIDNMPILRQAEVCYLMGITRMTLWRYETQKGLPSHRDAGMNPFYKKDELINWIMSRPDLKRINEKLQKDGYRKAKNGRIVKV